MKYLSVLTIAFWLTGCSGPMQELKATVDNNAGVYELARENDGEALNRFIAALATEPFNTRVQMNLGLAYEILEDFDRAYQSYALVLGAEELTAEEEFQALFNMARVEGARGRIGEALALYQSALKINPRSQEVKHNIELLMVDGGSGEGEGDDEGDEGSSEGDENQPPQNNNQEDQEQPQPEELRPEDVEQILEELSRQEKRIRAKEMEQNAGEPQDGKNW